ncbi:tripartite tricarboxylate transporter permease [Jiangella asiatica]|uniref:Tripartite tricarboxylate transporter permease n=1 Tax=Jiangella asiatica TaxID=2530372 RepID=A0A4R5DDI6_9ACTN|nr:tripartite tricarboxylate transporter permease [Jiangella asiatica]TDE11829.1 tripartite tricarboxylate transporter permease [Jiangella asiatica]
MTDILGDLATGFGHALTPANIGWVLLGVLVGTVVGVLPGLGSITAIALLIPVAFGLDPLSGLIMLCGVYFGSQYGSSTTAILVQTPGDMGSVVTTIDGHEMAKGGRAGPALATAAIGSFLAGTLSVVALTFLSPWLADAALQLGAAEYFLLMLLALLLVSTLTTGSSLKAVISALIGLALATVGINPGSGVPRLTFGSLELSSGFDFALVAISIFAVAEAARVLSVRGRSAEKREVGRIWMSKEDWRRSAGPWGRGSVVGFVIGVMPGIGPSLASYVSYILEKTVNRKHRREFGKGAIEGVAGPEAANNAGVGGALVPMFTLGIPGSSTTALLLFVFTMYGLQPGPQLLETNSTLVFGIIASLYIGNVALLALNLPLVGLFAQLLRIPTPHLYLGVTAFAVLGVYVLKFSQFDLYVMIAFGVLGFLIARYGFSAATLVLGMVLGPLLEQNLERALNISGGDPAVFVERPISRVLVVLIVVVLLVPLLSLLARRRRDRRPLVDAAAPGSERAEKKE